MGKTITMIVSKTSWGAVAPALDALDKAGADYAVNEGYIPGRRRHPGRWSDKTRVKRQKRLLKAFRRRVDRWVREVGARRDYQPMKLCGRELPGDAMCMDERFHPWACTPAVRWDASKQTWVSVMS